MNTYTSSPINTDCVGFLYRLSNTFSSSLDLDEVLRRVLDEIITETHAENGFIALRQPDESVTFPVARGFDSSTLDSPQSLVTPGIIEKVIDEGISIITSDNPVNESSVALQDIDSFDSYSIMCVPLNVREKVIGAVYVENCIVSDAFSEEDLELLNAIASTAAIAIENTRLHNDALEKSRMEQELLVARKVQSSFIPQIICQPENWEISAHLKPAREVGGDFYDVISLDKDRLIGLVIGDVCDKGVGSAIFMALFRSLIRAFSEQHLCSDGRLVKNKVEIELGLNNMNLTGSRYFDDDTSTLVNTVYLTNQYILNHHRDANMFSSLFFGLLNPETGSLQYINSGHEPPIVLNKHGIKKRLMPTGPVIGIFPDLSLRVERVQLSPGDTLLAYTDGVIDALNHDGHHFSEKRLLALAKPPSESPGELIERIINGIERYRSDQEQYDDVTLLAARWMRTKQDQTPIKLLYNK